MRVYLAGPMRGIPQWNFPAFDDAEALWRKAGHDVMSPASIDRAMGIKPGGADDPALTRRAIQFDLVCLFNADAIALLPGWEESSGATVELALAQFLNLKVYDAITFRVLKIVPKPWGLIPNRIFTVPPTSETLDMIS